MAKQYKLNESTIRYQIKQANLPTKYVSRQKLCLSGTEFWVNDVNGSPLMVVIGELTEKLNR